MGTFLARRLLLAVPTVFGVLLAVFLLIRLVPGDVVTQLIGLEATISPRRVDELRRLFGLDRSLPLQFADYVGSMLHGDLGKSLRTGLPVGQELLRRFPVTIHPLVLAGDPAHPVLRAPPGMAAPDLYVTSTYDFLRTPAEIIQAQLAKVGIRLKINAADWSVYLPTMFQKRYALTILGTSGQSDPDDFLYGNFHSKGGLNLVNYSDAQFDRLLEQGRATSDEAQRRRLYEQAQARLVETVPMVFIYHSTQYEAVRKSVRGFEHWSNTSYLGLRRAWMSGP